MNWEIDYMLNIREKAIFCGFMLSILFSFVGFSGQCEGISHKLLRLHVIANSDSNEDQALKLRVRDRVLEECSSCFEGADGLREAEKAAAENIHLITEAAKKEIMNSGYNYPVKVEIKKMYFNTRKYDTVTIPAGKYHAVRITIGEGKGKNWWCVMFPPMCLPAASERIELGEILSPEQMDIVEGGSQYEIKFRAVELFQEFRNWFDDLLASMFSDCIIDSDDIEISK